MSSFAEAYTDDKQRAFIDKWVPRPIHDVTLENLRWNIARANCAEAELRELKEALKTIKKVIA